MRYSCGNLRLMRLFSGIAQTCIFASDAGATLLALCDGKENIVLALVHL